jgi:5'-deoxynucleotidase YfbR-like HD superfamily hydrolase
MTLNLRELLTGKARLVAHVTRFAGTPVHRHETVAEHSFHTAFIALMLGKHCVEMGAAVDLGMLLERAIVHDIDEAIMVDLPRPVKYANPSFLQMWSGMCFEAVQGIESAIGVEFFQAWRNAKSPSLEGRILALADLISVTSYIIEELRFGNTFMQPLLAGNIAYLREFCAKEPSSEISALARDSIELALSFTDFSSEPPHVPADR